VPVDPLGYYYLQEFKFCLDRITVYMLSGRYELLYLQQYGVPRQYILQEQEIDNFWPVFAYTDLLCSCIALSMNQHNIRRVDILCMYISFQVGARTYSPEFGSSISECRHVDDSCESAGTEHKLLVFLLNLELRIRGGQSNFSIVFTFVSYGE